MGLKDSIENRTIISNNYVRLEYFPDKKRLVQTWMHYVPSDIFRETINTSLNFVKEHDVVSVLSDTLEQKVVSLDDAKFAAASIKNFSDAGVTAFAFVMPRNVFTKISLKEFEKSEAMDISQYFHNLDDANNWLDSKN